MKSVCYFLSKVTDLCLAITKIQAFGSVSVLSAAFNFATTLHLLCASSSVRGLDWISTTEIIFKFKSSLASAPLYQFSNIKSKKSESLKTLTPKFGINFNLLLVLWACSKSLTALEMAASFSVMARHFCASFLLHSWQTMTVCTLRIDSSARVLAALGYFVVFSLFRINCWWLD